MNKASPDIYTYFWGKILIFYFTDLDYLTLPPIIIHHFLALSITYRLIYNMMWYIPVVDRD